MAKVAVIGAGLIGRAWAISFARAGHEVTLADSAPAALDKAMAFVESVLPDLARYDLLEGQSAAEVRKRITTTGDLASALADVAHVQENAPEKLEVKKALFPELDRMAPPDAVLASSTSALLPSAFTASVKGRARCLVVHPINPPYLVPAVEVVPAPWTDPAVVARAADFMRKAGQAPIVMKREIDGFVMNRMQGALLQEAFRLVADGFASVEDVDVGLREGLALRWSFMGPFETIDLNAPEGVRDYVIRYKGIYERLAPSQMRMVEWAGPALDEIERDRRKRLKRDELGKRSIWRDRRLMALAQHKRRAAKDIGD